MTNHPLFPKEFPLKFPERSIWAKLCAVVLAFVFDGVCAQQASHETIVTAHGCLEAFPGELVHSTYHWCNKTTPLRRVGRRMGRRQGLAGSGRVHRLAQACTKLPRHLWLRSRDRAHQASRGPSQPLSPFLQTPKWCSLKNEPVALCRFKYVLFGGAR